MTTEKDSRETSAPGRTTFIITAPHATCIASDSAAGIHTCDSLAAEAAEDLVSGLAKSGADVLGPFVGDINRRTSDLNRAESRDRQFRRDVARAIGRARDSGSAPFVVDVHSFDPGSKWDYPGPGEPLLVLLDGRSSRRTAGIPEALRDRFPAELARRTSVGGSPINDIVATATELGAVGGVLVEFSERDLGSKRRRSVVVAQLVRGLVSLLHRR